MSVRRTVVLVALALGLPAAASAQKHAEDAPVPQVIGTGHAVNVVPRAAEVYETADGFAWSRVLQAPGASFLKAHVVGLNLRAGDVLVLRSASGKVAEELRGRGPNDLGTFWALSAFGDELALELHVTRPYAYVPFRIDNVILGDPAILEPNEPGDARSICFPENFDDVVCYQSDAGKWENVLASVGVMSVGGNPASALFCSGSNVSPLNYLLTNNHCITSQSGCDSSEFVFKFYRTNCNTGAPPTTDWQGYHCDQLVASSPFLSCDQGLSDLDFSLCSVIGDPASTFGFAQPDPNPLTDGEGIYIVQHPAGRPHEIAHGSGADVDVSGTVLRYYDTLDTEGGSSGSPIYRESDDKLVGLHHCGGCETAGVGNRGMLMSDIFPLIQGFLCTPGISLNSAGASDLTQVSGNGDVVVDPGETWQFYPAIRNGACAAVALGVSARIEVNAASAGLGTVLDPVVAFGDVQPGESVSSLTPVRVRTSSNAPCGTVLLLDLVDIQASTGGPFPDAAGVIAAEIGSEPIATVYQDGFEVPASWTVVDGGAGTGPASTWTTSNPGGRSLSFAAPFFIADSDEQGSGFTMNEELISPVIDATGYETVQLQFSHDFNWYSGGLNEQGDVDVRSSATGGSWVTVRNFSGGDASGSVQVDITAQAAGQTDVQIRFHYYDANFEWWWAVDDVFLLGSNGFVCNPQGGPRIRPAGGGGNYQAPG